MKNSTTEGMKWVAHGSAANEARANKVVQKGKSKEPPMSWFERIPKGSVCFLFNRDRAGIKLWMSPTEEKRLESKGKESDRNRESS